MNLKYSVFRQSPLIVSIMVGTKLFLLNLIFIHSSTQKFAHAMSNVPCSHLLEPEKDPIIAELQRLSIAILPNELSPMQDRIQIQEQNAHADFLRHKIYSLTAGDTLHSHWKVSLTDESDLQREITGYGVWDSLKLTRSRSPELIHSQDILLGTSPHKVLWTRTAKGLSIGAILENFQSHQSEARWRILKNALKSSALALAELHNRTRNRTAVNGDKFSSSIEYDLTALQETTEDGRQLHELVTKKILKRNEFQDLKQRILEVKNAYKNSSPIFYAVIHGDLTEQNIFYDNSTNQITFIDLETVP